MLHPYLPPIPRGEVDNDWKGANFPSGRLQMGKWGFLTTCSCVIVVFWLSGNAPAEVPGPGFAQRPGDQTAATFYNRAVALAGNMQLHVTATGDPIAGSSFNFT